MASAPAWCSSRSPTGAAPDINEPLFAALDAYIEIVPALTTMKYAASAFTFLQSLNGRGHGAVGQGLIALSTGIVNLSINRMISFSQVRITLTS
jgi:hypothetical protein